MLEFLPKDIPQASVSTTHQINDHQNTFDELHPLHVPPLLDDDIITSNNAATSDTHKTYNENNIIRGDDITILPATGTSDGIHKTRKVLMRTRGPHGKMR